MRISVVLRHARYQALEVLRAPGYLVPIFVFPTMFFLYFAQPDITSTSEANRFAACYTLYAILGVVFYLLLGEISSDRRDAWEDYLQTLPDGSWTRVSGWALTSWVAAAAAVLLVGVAAWLSTPLHLGASSWLLLLVVGMIGALPFGLLGMAVAYWAPPKFAQPLGNVAYFTLAFAGGFWTLPQGLPGWVSAISPYLPTRMWAEMAWAVADGRSWPYLSMLGLAGYGVLFGLVAYVGLHRYLRQRYQ